MTGMQWTSDPDDPRVVGALGRRCGVCGALPGTACVNLSATAHLKTGLVHESRVPDALIFGDIDHIPASKVRG